MNKKEALERLKRNREKGSTGLKDYKISEDKVFDEVDEASFQIIARKRLQDDFVVDDDGIGYADYGHDDWSHSANEFSSSSDDDDNQGGKSSGFSIH